MHLPSISVNFLYLIHFPFLHLNLLTEKGMNGEIVGLKNPPTCEAARLRIVLAASTVLLVVPVEESAPSAVFVTEGAC